MQQTLAETTLLCGGAGACVPLHRGSLRELPHHLVAMTPRWVILIDEGIPLELLASLGGADSSFKIIPWSGGEGCKTRDSKAALEDLLLTLPVDASWGICAMGGGALLDLAGYVASCLLRGLRLVLVPSTLVAMVDASIGSKNGINHPLGKNLLGTLYDPSAIWQDDAFIHQMPLQLLREGAAEMIKHALIGAREQLPQLTQIGNILFADSSAGGALDRRSARDQLASLILSNLQVKDCVVRRSHSDPEWRHILNAGHTLAHGWESASGYRLSHGEAVGAGLMVEAQLALDLGHLQRSSLQQLTEALQAWKFDAPSMPWEQVMPFLLRDKKNEAGRLLLSLPSETSARHIETETGLFRRTEVQLSHLQQVYQRCQPAVV